MPKKKIVAKLPPDKLDRLRERMRDRLAKLRATPEGRQLLQDRLSEAAGAFVGAKVAEGTEVEVDAALLTTPFGRGLVAGVVARAIADAGPDADDDPLEPQ